MLIYNDKTITDSNIIQYVEYKQNTIPFIYNNDLRFYPKQGFINTQTTHLSFGIQPLYLNERTELGEHLYDVIEIDPEFGVKTNIGNIYDAKEEHYEIDNVDITESFIDYTYVVERLTKYDATINILAPNISSDSTDYYKYVSIANKYNKPEFLIYYLSALSSGTIFTLDNFLLESLSKHNGFFFKTYSHPSISVPYSLSDFNGSSEQGYDTCYITLPGINTIYTLDNIFYNIVDGDSLSFLNSNIFQTSWGVLGTSGTPDELDYIHEQNIDENPWKLDQTDIISNYCNFVEQRIINYNKFDYTFTTNEIEELDDDISPLRFVGGKTDTGTVSDITLYYGLITRVYIILESFFIPIYTHTLINNWVFSDENSLYLVSFHDENTNVWINKTNGQTIQHYQNALKYGTIIHLLGGYTNTAKSTLNSVTYLFDTIAETMSTSTSRTLHTTGSQYLYNTLLLESQYVNEYNPETYTWRYIKNGIETLNESIGFVLRTDTNWYKLNKQTMVLIRISAPARTANSGSKGIYSDNFIQVFGNATETNGAMYRPLNGSWSITEQLPIKYYYGVDRW